MFYSFSGNILQMIRELPMPTPPRLIFEEGERITQDNKTVLLFIFLQLLYEDRSTYHTCPGQVHSSAIFSDFPEGCNCHH